MNTQKQDLPELSPLHTSDALWIAISAWVGFVVLSLFDHLFFGLVFGLDEAFAVLSSAALGGGVLAAGLGVLSLPLLPLWSSALTRRPVLFFRLEIGLLVVLWTEALWCLGDYFRDPRLPIFTPHPMIALLGTIPALLMGAVVVWRTQRAASLGGLLLTRFGLLLLIYGGLLWLPRFNFYSLQLFIGVVIFLLLGALSGLWVRAKKRRMMSLLALAPMVVGFFFGWQRLSNSHWARDAAIRGGRLSRISLQIARPLLLSEQNGLISLAQGSASKEMLVLSPSSEYLGSLKEELLKTKPKNLLWITVDALRADMGGTGARIPTIEWLKKEGVNFLMHRSGAANTIESLHSLFLGSYPWVKIETKSFFDIMRESGFYTLGILPNYYILKHNDGWLQAGFDQLAYDLPYPIPSAPVSMPMTELLLTKITEIGDKPFVVWIHYDGPHKPYDAEGDTDRERYSGEVLSNDRALRKLFDGLEVRGLLDNTLIILSADHGEEFYEHGGATHGLTLYDEILHVPMIIRAPGGVVRGEILQNTAAVDVAPTLLSLMGITAPESFAPFGLDLFQTSADSVVFSFGRLTKAANVGEASTVRGTYKLIYNFKMQSAQLYDLATDPAERTNLVEEKPEVAAALAQALLVELQKSGLNVR
jgi:hypothetical protein